MSPDLYVPEVEFKLKHPRFLFGTDPYGNQYNSNVRCVPTVCLGCNLRCFLLRTILICLPSQLYSAADMATAADLRRLVRFQWYLRFLPMHFPTNTHPFSFNFSCLAAGISSTGNGPKLCPTRLNLVQLWSFDDFDHHNKLRCSVSDIHLFHHECVLIADRDRLHIDEQQLLFACVDHVFFSKLGPSATI
jgi:hypothetical protein